MKNKISIILIILGGLIFSYPFLERAYTYIMQQRALDNYEKTIAEVEASLTDEADEEAYQEFVALEDIFQNSVDLGELPVEESTVEESTEEETPTNVSKPTSSPLNPIGIIKISKIDLKLPIYDGTSERYLKVGVGRIKGTSSLGEIGNVALAGHRSRTYGRFLNRLNELEVGDEIIVEEGGNTYSYTVYKTHIVEPEDVSVLYRNNKDRVLTLVTCDPIETATHRLIVHAVANE
ncbi:class D sortase [Alkaliphilus serpentinus]|uniref:Class D sortase n=1 Tax=Alkaliphilus serpentinus TaxID=1482731 RepID=A0A833MAC9_9FIRM|nr:class D sortase [Alkaliphilus serpentinus]KAB3531840.1 class D sortase [Alkaliphilus serpentinus]